MDERAGGPVPDEEAEDMVLALFSTFDPVAHHAAMLRHGGTWSQQEHDNAGLRGLMLSTLDPADGTPEAEELAAVFARQDEYEEASHSTDEQG